MGFSNQKKRTEFERVRDWKRKNPEKVANQRHRKILRKKAAERAADPTGELNYGPLEGVDTPYGEDKPLFPPQQPRQPEGIEEPPEFTAELEREHKRRILENMRKNLEGK